MRPKTLAIIPARMAATRFPNKPLKKILDIPMIGHIIIRAQMSENLDEIYVATCDKEIFDYSIKMGCKSVMTSDKHTNCLDRSAEALSIIENELQIKFDIVAVIQGDEPFIVPEIIKQAVDSLNEDDDLAIVNIMRKIDSIEDLNNEDIVKVVVNQMNNALYMSREPIPTLKKGNKGPWMKQTGLLFFRRDKLVKFSELQKTPLEISEAVDMNRMLEHGEVIRMLETTLPCLSVDSPEDLLKVEKIMIDDQKYQNYKGQK